MAGGDEVFEITGKGGLRKIGCLGKNSRAGVIPHNDSITGPTFLLPTLSDEYSAARPKMTFLLSAGPASFLYLRA